MLSAHTRGEEFLQLLTQARAGSPAALGELLEFYRNYLLSIAQGELDPLLQTKVAPSDIVQDTFLEVQRLILHFRGEAVEQFHAWLRSILLHKVAEQRNRFFGTQKRQLSLERSLDEQNSVAPLGDPMPSTISTPSAQAIRQEEAELLRQAVERLPEPQRQVLLWHHWEVLPFAEIGRRLNRSEDAVRMIFGRALDRLTKEMERERLGRSGDAC
jgi:RNA polymerase sigma-70 factor (ECF subfamily)